MPVEETPGYLTLNSCCEATKKPAAYCLEDGTLWPCDYGQHFLIVYQRSWALRFFNQSLRDARHQFFELNKPITPEQWAEFNRNHPGED
jgi:hypothetical protein